MLYFTCDLFKKCVRHGLDLEDVYEVKRSDVKFKIISFTDKEDPL